MHITIIKGYLQRYMKNRTEEVRAKDKENLIRHRRIKILIWTREIQRNLVIVKQLCFVVLDIDECANANPPDCQVNAVCNNTHGSYVCTCKLGFYKDGENCTSN